MKSSTKAVRTDCLLLLLPIVLAAASCSPGGSEAVEARSAILITLDTTRYDALGVNGCPAPVTPTPNLDAMGREALVYDWGRAVSPLTLPSHASMMTGLYPLRHGLRDNGFGSLSPDAVTLAERAGEAGIDSAAFIASVVLSRQFGLDQGFDLYSEPSRPEQQVGTHFSQRPATEVVREAVSWLKGRDPSDRFLMWVHLFDPHVPYDAPDEFLRRMLGHPYMAEVAAMDHELGKLFATLRSGGFLDDTIVMIVADHGEDLLDHGEPTHGHYCYDSTVKVPFILRYPDGYRAGSRSAEVVSIVDVYPTILEALGLGLPEHPRDVDGISLFGREVPEDRGVYFETYTNYIHYGWSQLAGWADRRGKYIHSSSPEFYRPASDTMERNDLFPVSEETLRPYREALARLAERTALPVVGEFPMDSTLRAQLVALGYADPGFALPVLPAPLEPSDRPAPAARVQELRDQLQAVGLSDRGRYDEAIALLEKILASNPANLSAMDRLGFCFAQQGRWPEVIRTLTRRLEVGYGKAETHINLGFAYESTGRPREALEHYRQALEVDPGNRTGRTNLDRVLNLTGDAGRDVE